MKCILPYFVINKKSLFHFFCPSSQKSGVCQVRLDFIKFTLSPVDLNGDCSGDSLTIAGADNVRNMVICGENGGQHLYLHYGASDRISVNLNLNSQNNRATYDILVTLVKCSSSSSSSCSSSTSNKKRIGRSLSKSSSDDDDDSDTETTIIYPGRSIKLIYILHAY